MDVSMICRLVAETLKMGAVRGTQYVSPKEIVRVTRRRYDGKFPAQGKPVELMVSSGRPNYRERLFIKKCKKAGEPFPVKKIQWTWMKGIPPQGNSE
jgi:hypothetical protein